MNPSKAEIYKYLNVMRNPTREQMIARTIEAAMIDDEKEKRLKELYQQVQDDQNPYTNNPNEMLRQYMIANSIKAAYKSINGSAMGYKKKTSIRGGNSALDNYKKVSLSNHDIYNMLDGKTKVLTYPELMEYDNINDLLSPHNSCVILYMTNDDYGHWCTLTRSGGKISFFDPYGGKNLPDQELKSIPQHFRNKSGQTYPHLTYLLYNSGNPVEYNEHKYQEFSDNVNTCGRHAICRVLYKDLNSDQYYDLMKSLSKETGLNFDEVVTMITEKLKR